MSKPAMLQINARGSWRNVCEFDVADADATDRIMEAAATLAAYSTDKPSVRVVKDEAGYAVPLMRWTQDGGWRRA
ncbi:hypothetical protein [Alicycliphilus denitrificans]|uniref:hypothetical protein n=1 Tax=Alicycliphilus denitrificans TaxID=179636 RepID=UPI0001D9EDDE|nr:hypothetical protein [Alicycliphilus denitrificans]ADU99789.1 hypothetical protein Alide_2046 [Alicycliphilus denitrificans BC]